jgi:hypothetical protein
MRRMMRAAAIAAAVLSIAPAAWAQAPAAPAQAPLDPDIQRLMELTGASKTGAMVASLLSSQILQQMHQQHPDIPARAVDIVQTTLDEQFKTAFAPDGPLMRDLTAIWSRHFTHDEIIGLITFYETPLGRKMNEAIPAIAQESAHASTIWARENMPEIQKTIQDRLRAEGLIK